MHSILLVVECIPNLLYFLSFVLSYTVCVWVREHGYVRVYLRKINSPALMLCFCCHHFTETGVIEVVPSIVRVVVRHLSETVLLYSGRILAVETSKPTLSITTELGVT